MIQIPITKNGNTNFIITLDGATYEFQQRYNTRNKRIYLSILRDDIMLLSGLRLLDYLLPTLNYSTVGLPVGLLMVSKLAATEDHPTLGNFGVNQEWSLVYFTESEVTIT